MDAKTQTRTEIMVNTGAPGCKGDVRLEVMALADAQGVKQEWIHVTCDSCTLEHYQPKTSI